jgi:hypothetical protein
MLVLSEHDQLVVVAVFVVVQEQNYRYSLFVV